MKNLKRIVFLFTALCMLVLPVSCAKSGDADTTPEPSPSPTEEIPEATDGGDEGGAYDNFVMDYSAGIENNGFWTGVNAHDFIGPFEYSGIEIPYTIHTVSDEALQAEIDYLLASYTTTSQVTDRAAVSGDTVNIDYVGSVDGAEFTGGSTGGLGTEVTIGVTQYIDDFLDQIIGHMPGDTFDINVTFPEEYGNEELNGKDAVFVTTLNYISESIVPELTDEFVASNLFTYGWATVDELKTAITESLSTTAVTDYIKQHILGLAKLRFIPEDVMTYQRNAAVNSYIQYAQSYNMDLEALLMTIMGVESVDALLEMLAADIEASVAYFIAIQWIAEEMELNITETEVQSYFQEVTGSTDYSQYEAAYGFPYLAQAVLSDTIGKYLTENAVYLES